MCKYDYIVYAEGGYNREVKKGAYARIVLDGKTRDIIDTASKTLDVTKDLDAHIVSITSAITHLPDNCSVLIYTDATPMIDGLVLGEEIKVRKGLISTFHKRVKDKGVKVEIEWHGLSLNDPLTTLCWQGCSAEVGADFGDYYQRWGKFGIHKPKIE